MRSTRREALKLLGMAAVGSAFVAEGVVSSEYCDVMGFDDKHQQGRTKNALATMVAGIVGQQLYGNSRIDLEVEKHWWPDTTVTGHTTPDEINTYLPVWFSSSRFKARNNQAGDLEGEVHKSEFNWKVRQTGQGSYEIKRWGPKFDGRLQLHVGDGRITGTYVRTGPHFDWKIDGTYDAQGNTSVLIDGPLMLSVGLKGTIRDNNPEQRP